MGLFKRKSNNESVGKKEITKVLFTSDVHGSEIAFRKFLNAAKMYKVDALVIGGDLAGKTLVPIVDVGEGKYEIQGEQVGKEGLSTVIQEFKKSGTYYTIVDKKEYKEMLEDKRKVDERFNEAIKNVLEDWVSIAKEKLKDNPIPLYVNLGNDDPMFMFDVVESSEVMEKSEGTILELGSHEMVSFGYVNPTPWNTPREMKEEEIYGYLKKEVERLKEPSTAIFNFHAPPYGTNLDNAPLLSKDLKPVVKGGDVVMTHVGSTSIRKLIEEYSPMLGIHGHIHESRAFDKIGKTVVINPGSEYGEGILHATYIVLEREKVKTHQFVLG
ncbi:metallophosphoesterase family protein [Sulfuracidifex metallicus]|uniref:Calcineurin-like phosphoesterase domain-containing protein n=1 Tax=Sulfuracidifex metallicus DSM 6482 = JCM 9184 TaxID=523847 RepID=A0A6A9QJF4_SULME|nr:metallophosphoesterase [Sulfuracidifex metallicus]MUN29126.1 hypothetical protein [Sulfuracidifex metallicus DSM 6482 = JCM 9184]